MRLTTHCLTIFVAQDGDGRVRDAPVFVPVTSEDIRLRDHALELIQLRAH